MRYSNKYLHDYGILRDYNGRGFKLVSLVLYRQAGIEDDSGKHYHTPKGEGGNKRKLVNNLSRTKSKIKELCLCNPWQWFVTFTLDPQKYDRMNLSKFIKDLSQMIRDYRKRTGYPVKYLLIPEHHKDGCWHMHGLLLGLPADELHAFSLSEHLPQRIRKRLQSGVQVYTWEEYASRFGYASIEEIRNQEAVSGYIIKYITKDALNTISELNAHAFYASKGLERATIIHQDILSQEIESPDFSNEHCAVKWFQDLEAAFVPFMEKTYDS